MLAACATSGGPGAAAPPAASGQATQATAPREFTLEGRLSVHYGEESLSGKYSWAHTPQTDQVSLATPLGNQIAQISRDASGVTLINNRQDRFRARDVESLTEAQLGWRLPLTGLTDWVHGRAGSPNAQAERDAGGRLTRLQEAGWVIDYSYADASPQPQRLVLNYPRADKPLEIRLVIDSRS